jgi:GNAT superfamily N-acetyltransferase
MVSIVEVKSKAQLRKFVDYPNQLYKDVPEFVPATYDDDLSDWDPKKNPAFAYCEARCWLAYRDDEIVGRIGAILSHKANEKWGTNRMRFTQVDFIDDREVSTALFETVEKWAAEKGCNEVQGPLGFTDLDREGMLVEGFDRRSCFFTYYNYPYYIDHLTALGYGKDVDWVENYITVPYDEKTLNRWQKLSDFALKHYHLHTVTAKSRLAYIPLLKGFFKLINVAYAPLYGTVELSDEQIKKYSVKFAPLINPKLAGFIMDENNQMVGMGVGAPSIAEALKKSRGRLLPFGWVRMLKAFRKNDTIDLLLIAVHPRYQGKGVNAVVINKVVHGCVEMGITHAETGPMLETNEKVQDQWKDVPLEQHKRRRCFIKRIAE